MVTRKDSQQARKVEVTAREALQQSSHKVYPHLGILIGLPPKLITFTM